MVLQLQGWMQSLNVCTGKYRVPTGKMFPFLYSISRFAMEHGGWMDGTMYGQALHFGSSIAKSLRILNLQERRVPNNFRDITTPPPAPPNFSERLRTAFCNQRLPLSPHCTPAPKPKGDTQPRHMALEKTQLVLVAWRTSTASLSQPKKCRADTSSGLGMFAQWLDDCAQV